MNPITIQCTRCDAYLVLSSELLERVAGKTGRVSCHGCAEKVRLDARSATLGLRGARHVEDVELELDLAPSVREPKLSLLPPAPEDEAAEEIDAVESVREPVRRPRALPPSLRPRASKHAALRPPRPTRGARPSTPPQPSSNPFDELGSLAPVVPLQGVRLTEDGRLINRADEAKPKPRSRVRTWAPLVVAAVLATGLASARVGSILPLRLQRAEAPRVKQVAALVLEAPAATALPVEELRILAEVGEATLVPETSAPHSGEAHALAGSQAVAAGALGASTEVVAEGLDAPNAEPTSAAGEQVDPGQADSDPTETAQAETPEVPSFSRDAASVALQHAAAEAQSCRQAGDPSGMARIVVTFAPSGRVTTANITGRLYAGTATGGCIAGRFRGATVPAFSGGHVTVTKTISID